MRIYLTVVITSQPGGLDAQNRIVRIDRTSRTVSLFK